MALHGNLTDFSITQLLNLVNLSRKSGTLVVDGSAGSAWLAFEKGKLTFVKVGKENTPLGNILFQNRKISQGVFEFLKKFGSEPNDKEVGLYLISAGMATRDEINTLIQQHYAQQIRKLYSWKDGIFQFLQDAHTPEDKIPARIHLEDLIVEGARQSSRGKALVDDLPDPDAVLKFPEKPRHDIKNINLNKEEWRVISFVKPGNTIRQIGIAAGLEELETRRIVFGLLQASIVEIERNAPQPKPGVQTRKLTQPEIEEQKSLVTRIIGRFRPNKA
jgi:hypothetical protein